MTGRNGRVVVRSVLEGVRPTPLNKPFEGLFKKKEEKASSFEKMMRENKEVALAAFFDGRVGNPLPIKPKEEVKKNAPPVRVKKGEGYSALSSGGVYNPHSIVREAMEKRWATQPRDGLTKAQRKEARMKVLAEEAKEEAKKKAMQAGQEAGMKFRLAEEKAKEEDAYWLEYYQRHLVALLKSIQEAGHMEMVCDLLGGREAMQALPVTYETFKALADAHDVVCDL